MDLSKGVDLSKKRNLSVVKEGDIGIYVWEMPDGSWVADEDRNWMHIVAKRGDLKRISQLQDAARGFGIEEGRPVFVENVRPVTEEEYEEQRQRLLLGLVPDPEDNYSQLDDLRNGRT